MDEILLYRKPCSLQVSTRVGPHRSWKRHGLGPDFARLLLGLSVLMMMVPTFLYFHGELRHPLLLEGDKIVEAACPDCHGSGKAADKIHRCARCDGRGVIAYVVAGPKRPTQIVGHVYAPDSEQPVNAADVHLETGSIPIDLKTDDQGRFGVTLPPGNYTLNVKAPQGTYLEPLPVSVIAKPQPADRDLSFMTIQQAFHLKKP